MKKCSCGCVHHHKKSDYKIDCDNILNLTNPWDKNQEKCQENDKKLSTDTDKKVQQKVKKNDIIKT